MKRTNYICDRCGKQAEVTNLAHPAEGKLFFIFPVPNRFSFNVDLCDSCYNLYKKIIKRFMQEK